MPDLFKETSVKEAGRSFFSDAGESFQPVFKQFKVFQEKNGQRAKVGLKIKLNQGFLKRINANNEKLR